MGKKMFVGGLPYEVDEAKLRELFGTYGKVVGAKVIMDRETGRSKGFGFVEMSTDEEAKAATEKLNNSAVGERKIFVNEARPMEPRAPGSAPRSGPPSRPSFGGGGGGGGGGRPSFGDKPSFGPSFGEGKGGYGAKRGGFGADKNKRGKKGDYDKKGGSDGKKPGFEDKKGRKGEKFDVDDDGDSW
jgi:RNA recognition motif-containing protein